MLSLVSLDLGAGWNPVAAGLSLAAGAAAPLFAIRLHLVECEQDLTRRRLWILLAGVVTGAGAWAAAFLAILGAGGFERIFHAPDIVAGLAAATAAGTAGAAVSQWRGLRLRLPLGAAVMALAQAAALAAALHASGTAELSPAAVPSVAGAALSAVALHRLLAGGGAGLACLVQAAAWAVFAAGAARTTAMSRGLGLPAEELVLVLGLVGALVGLVAGVTAATDRTARREARLRYRHMATHDDLTGLPNRPALIEKLDAALASPMPGRRVGLVGIDLDRFKPVNDVHGHEAGDLLLRTIARGFLDALGPNEMVARMGGDEFVALKTDARTRAEVAEFAGRLRRAALRPAEWQARRLSVGASVGACVAPDDGADRRMLMSRVDLALYRAKGGSAGPVCFYDASMDEASRNRSSTAIELRNALEERQFELHYQPQVALRAGALVGFEALLRWNHPERGRVPPDEFIPVAESCGLICDIGAWVLHASCREAASWERPFRIAVNVAPQQIAHPDFVEVVEDALLVSGLAPERLELEVTEASMISDQAHALAVMGRLKTLGVRVAMDDYGTGFASLSMLRTFPFDKIKIDREFVFDLGRDPQATAIVQSTLILCKALGIPVLAEGVEEAEQARWLVSEGCLEAQGYFFGRPVPSRELPGAREFERSLKALEMRSA